MAHGQKITEAEACDYLSNFRLVDPFKGPATWHTDGSDCFRLQTAAGVVVYALRRKLSGCWVSAAAGHTISSICPELALAVEIQARETGAACIGFQTARRGLVRRAMQHGYTLKSYVTRAGVVTGYIMEKALCEHP